MSDRAWFTCASRGFREVVTHIRTDQLDHQGVGVWNVRALLGHAVRAFLTIEEYLAPPGSGTDVEVEDAAGYYRLASARPSLPAEIAARGQHAGDSLGPDPVAAALDIVDRVNGLVGASAAARVRTPAGGMRLDDYLGTRAFELTVHGIDLALATNQDTPRSLEIAAVAAIELCGRIATGADRLDILLALTGRSTLCPNFSVV